jgi:uncharacterized coiled-coil DUF342 family protein
MAEYKRFRASIGGFNRQDVADYIEQMCSEHREQLLACRKECDELKQACAQAELRRDELAAKVKRLHELFGELEETFREIDAEREN